MLAMVASDRLAPKQAVLLEALSWSGCSTDTVRGCSTEDGRILQSAVAAASSAKSTAATSCVVAVATGCCCCGTTCVGDACAEIGCGNGCSGVGGGDCSDAPCDVADSITAAALGCGDGTTTLAAGAGDAVAAHPNFQGAAGCVILCTLGGEVDALAPTGAQQLPGPGVQEFDPKPATGLAVFHGQGTCAQRDVPSGVRGD